MEVRMKIRLLLPLFGALLGLAQGVQALDVDHPPLAQFIATLSFQEHIKEVKPIEALELYALILDDGQIFYADIEKSLLFKGEVYHLLADSVKIISQEIEQQKGQEVFAALQQLQPITYAAKKEVLSVIIFTDTECPFCQKLHQDVDKLQAAGVTVKYAAYPRAGVESSAYESLVNVWCAKDSHEAMDRIKKRRRVSSAQCDNPVAQHFELGRYLGIRGTPAILQENGAVITGYRNVEDLLVKLGIN